MSITNMGAESPKTYARTNGNGKSQNNAGPSAPNQRGYNPAMKSNESLGKSKVPPVVKVM
jgi:hypothetical protein